MLGCPAAPAHPVEQKTVTSAPPSTDAAVSSEVVDASTGGDASPEDARPETTPIATPAPVTCTDDLPAGSPAKWKSCVAPGDCRLAYRGCCAPCTMPTACDVVAIAGSQESAFLTKTCGSSTPGCPACLGASNPDLHAACRKGRCVTVDLPADPSSACNSDDDCVARPPDCCGPCGPGGAWIALRKDAVASYVAEVCGKTKCPQCKTKPAAPKAMCDAKTRHCVVAP